MAKKQTSTKKLRLRVRIDFDLLRRLVPTANWVVETGLMTDDEAAKAIADELVRTIVVEERV